jgi:hypothetical protein
MPSPLLSLHLLITSQARRSMAWVTYLWYTVSTLRARWVCVVSFVVKRWQSSAPHGPAHAPRERSDRALARPGFWLAWMVTEW